MTAEALRTGAVAGTIRACRLIVVLRRIEPRERLIGLIDELADAGARVFEITFDAPSAAADIAAAREHLRGRAGGAAFLVGAGTVTDGAQLEAARAAGADFAVAPILDVPLVRASVEAGLPFVPGAMTPTEMAAAWQAGATFVKLFPASAVGPSFVREIRGPLPHVAIIPTGGVDGTNASAFLDAGAAAVGIGSALTRAEAETRRAIVAALAPR
jgi:2-dehydro-3-deoxyphosphogluconate aldolase/(4S)-4-hydroxy-2-oxoglutarate aldolase